MQVCPKGTEYAGDTGDTMKQGEIEHLLTDGRTWIGARDTGASKNVLKAFKR